MLSLARNGYTVEAVKVALQVTRTEGFRYDLLDSKNNYKAALTNVQAASVSHDSTADIKRSAKFTVRDDGSINYLSDRIKPWMRLKMPDGGFVEFPLGIFLLTTPTKKTDGVTTTRDIEAYDQAQILRDDPVTDRYTVKSGASTLGEVSKILIGSGISQVRLDMTGDKPMPADRDWEPGTTKLQITNDLLALLNYKTLTFDGDGFAVAEPYVRPDVRSAEYTYVDDGQSVIFPDATQTFDLFSVPNYIVGVVSQADMPVLRSEYTNTNPASLTSTASRGRTITRYESNLDAADQASLDAIVQRIAFETSQVYEEIEFDTAIMPMHADADVYTLAYSALGVNAKFNELAWSFELKAGARMKHKCRRVVAV